MTNLGYATLSLIPNARGFGGTLGSEFVPALQAEGEKAGAVVGKGFSGVAAKFVGPLAVATVVASVVAGLGGLISEAAAASDATQKFGSTLQFAGIANDQIKSLTASTRDYANKTVYGIADIQNITAQLASNGVPHFDQLAEAAGNLNAVAGGTAETYKSVGMVLTQTAGQGKLTTENWNQLADAIPGASGKLQTAMLEAGAYTGNFRDAMAAGEITAGEFNDAIMKLGFDPVAVSAARSTTTIEGALGNLQATAVGSLSDLITFMKPAITGVLNGVANGVSGASGLVGDFFSGFTKGTDAIDSAQSKAAVFGALFHEAFQTVKGAVSGKGFASSLPPSIAGPLEQVGREIGSVVAAVAPYLPQIGASLVALIGPLLQIASGLSPFSLLMRVLLPVLPALAGLIAQFAAMLGPLLADGTVRMLSNFQAFGRFFSTLIGLYLPLWSSLFDDWLSYMKVLVPTLVQVVTAAAPVVGMLLSLAGVLISAVLASDTKMFALLGEALADIATVVGDLVSALVPLAAVYLAALIPELSTIASAVLPPVIQVLEFVVSAIAPLVALFKSVMIPTIQALLPVLQAVLDFVARAVGAAMTILQGVIDVALGLLSGDWSRVWSGLGKIVDGIWSGVVNLVTSVLAVLGLLITAALSLLGAYWGTAWAAARSFLGDVWRSATDALSHGMSDVFGFFRDLGTTALKGLSGLVDLVDVGRHVVEGFLNGVKSFIVDVARAMLAPVAGLVDLIRAALGIHSPSAAMEAVGAEIGEHTADRLKDADSYAAPMVVGGGFMGALRAVSDTPLRGHRFVFDDHGVSNEGKEAKIARAATMLESLATARGAKTA